MNNLFNAGCMMIMHAQMTLTLVSTIFHVAVAATLPAHWFSVCGTFDMGLLGLTSRINGIDCKQCLISDTCDDTSPAVRVRENAPGMAYALVTLTVRP